MAKNPFDGIEGAKPRTKTQQEHVDYGNADLARIGRRDVHWFIHDGRVCIGPRLEREPPRLSVVR